MNIFSAINKASAADNIVFPPMEETLYFIINTFNCEMPKQLNVSRVRRLYVCSEKDKHSSLLNRKPSRNHVKSGLNLFQFFGD